MNNINYINHILYQPSHDQRNFENDCINDFYAIFSSCMQKMSALYRSGARAISCHIKPFCKKRGKIACLSRMVRKCIQPRSNKMELAQRVSCIALPFISLYAPAGKALSIGLGSIRSISNIGQTLHAAKAKETVGCFLAVSRTALSMLGVASTVFSSVIGHAVTTVADIGTTLGHVIRHIWAKEYEKALEQLVQVASSALYLALMATGSLEVALASVLLQGAIALHKAIQEYKEGRFCESIAQIVMGTIRCYQAKGYVELIQKRNSYAALEKFAQLMERAKKVRDVGHLYDSKLHQKGAETVYKGVDGKDYNFGAHHSEHGKGLVKGMNLQVRSGQMNEIDFKINHVFRDRLETIIKGLQSFTPDELQDVLAITKAHAKSIKIEKVPYVLSSETNQSMDTAYQISFEGIGKVLVGASPDSPNMYDRVRLVMDQDKSIYDGHEMLSFLQLDDAFKKSSEDDIERLKMGQLFRIFYPNEATSFERSADFFDASVGTLKEKIVQKVPSMQKVFEDHLAKMKTTEILPGKLRYIVPEVSKIAYENGARALIASVTGGWGNQKYNQVASMLKMGMLSSELRFRNGVGISGMSSNADFHTGGADSVFTQMLTEKNFSAHMSLNNLYYSGNVRVLISLEALNSGTYQSHYDSFGTRKIGSGYSFRENIFDFSKEEQIRFHGGNEVMFKERIDPSMITGLIVANEQGRSELVATLRSQGLVEKNSDGVETIMGKLLTSFIHVTSNLSPGLLL